MFNYETKRKSIKELMYELGFISVDYDTNVRDALVEVLQSRNKIQQLEDYFVGYLPGECK